eukprot:g653.t1
MYHFHPRDAEKYHNAHGNDFLDEVLLEASTPHIVNRDDLKAELRDRHARVDSYHDGHGTKAFSFEKSLRSKPNPNTKRSQRLTRRGLRSAKDDDSKPLHHPKQVVERKLFQKQGRRSSPSSSKKRLRRPHNKEQQKRNEKLQMERGWGKNNVKSEKQNSQARPTKASTSYRRTSPQQLEQTTHNYLMGTASSRSREQNLRRHLDEVVLSHHRRGQEEDKKPSELEIFQRLQLHSGRNSSHENLDEPRSSTISSTAVAAGQHEPHLYDGFTTSNNNAVQSSTIEGVLEMERALLSDLSTLDKKLEVLRGAEPYLKPHLKPYRDLSGVIRQQNLHLSHDNNRPENNEEQSFSHGYTHYTPGLLLAEGVPQGLPRVPTTTLGNGTKKKQQQNGSRKVLQKSPKRFQTASPPSLASLLPKTVSGRSKDGHGHGLASEDSSSPGRQQMYEALMKRARQRSERRSAEKDPYTSYNYTNEAGMKLVASPNDGISSRAERSNDNINNDISGHHNLVMRDILKRSTKYDQGSPPIDANSFLLDEESESRESSQRDTDELTFALRKENGVLREALNRYRRKLVEIESSRIHTSPSPAKKRRNPKGASMNGVLESKEGDAGITGHMVNAELEAERVRLESQVTLLHELLMESRSDKGMLMQALARFTAELREERCMFVSPPAYLPHRSIVKTLSSQMEAIHGLERALVH